MKKLKKLLIGIREFFTKNTLKVVSIFCLLLVYGLISGFVYSERVNRDLSRSLVRLHVIANSDSAQDQKVKLLVRDSIIQYMQENTGKMTSANEAKEFINNNLKEFAKISGTTLEQNGFNYTAKAVLGTFSFPSKTYGEVALPAGNYEALRIILGDGAGKNWWCVMFPPLCFVDSTNGILPDHSRVMLQDSLSEDEYFLATSNTSTASSDVKIKFKIVEMFQKTKTKLARSSP